MNPAAAPALDPAVRRSARIQMWLVLVVCAAPVIAAFGAYFFDALRPAAYSNYGTLIEPQMAVPPLALTTLDGRPFDLRGLRGKWVMLQVDGGACGPPCVDKLYAMRQVRASTGKDRDRVERVWLVSDDAPVSADLARAYEGMHVLRVDPARLTLVLPLDERPGSRLSDTIWVVDPLGNLMLRFPRQADPKGIRRDIGKLLYASRIG